MAAAASCGAGTGPSAALEGADGGAARGRDDDGVLAHVGSSLDYSAAPPVARNSSRPISMRRISLVPAPIS
jgi:hypothetical protein